MRKYQLKKGKFQLDPDISSVKIKSSQLIKNGNATSITYTYFAISYHVKSQCDIDVEHFSQAQKTYELTYLYYVGIIISTYSDFDYSRRLGTYNELCLYGYLRNNKFNK